MLFMAGESSFDVVSRVDRQEVDNALQQTAKEVKQRYDFQGTGASIEWSGDKIELVANSELRVQAIWDVFQTKLIRRGVSLKAIEAGEPKMTGQQCRIEAELHEGLNQEQAKKVAKVIRDAGPRGVRTQVTGDELKVASKSRDDLQTAIALLKGTEFDFAIQFVNYR
jgi:uncharacterized protein YajQ (UPF0234 family)